MRSENMAKVAVNAVRLSKFEKKLTGYRGRRERYGKRFMATFRAGVILRMRRELRGL